MLKHILSGYKLALVGPTGNVEILALVDDILEEISDSSDKLSNHEITIVIGDEFADNVQRAIYREGGL